MEGGVRTLRLFATALLLTAGALLAPAVRPPPAAAQEPQAFVSITLTSIEPALPSPDSTVTLKGTVTNTSPGVLSNLQAIFWRAPNLPLLTGEALNRSLTWPADEPLGERLIDNYQNIPTETNRTLAPGKSTPFTVRATMDELNFSLENGVYLIGVHVRGRTEVNGADITLGRARVFLPVQTAKPANSVQMTSVVILNSRPSRVGTSKFSDDHLAREVAAGGRLDRLIKAADADNVSFAIDPALIDELRTMKSGYSVIGSDAGTDKGQSAATRWLEKFESVKSTRDGFQLLYGSPDIAALVHSNETKLLTQGELAARTVEGVSTLPVLVFPAGGTADAETLAAAEALEPTAILLSDISTGELRPLLTAPGKAPVISFTASSFGGGPGPDPRNTAVHVQQRTLAETWIEAILRADRFHPRSNSCGQKRSPGRRQQCRVGQCAVDHPRHAEQAAALRAGDLGSTTELSQSPPCRRTEQQPAAAGAPAGQQLRHLHRPARRTRQRESDCRFLSGPLDEQQLAASAERHAEVRRSPTGRAEHDPDGQDRDPDKPQSDHGGPQGCRLPDHRVEHPAATG